MLGLMTLAAPAMAQESVIRFEDDTAWLPSILLERDVYSDALSDRRERLVPISDAELSELRASGIDPSWINARFDIPSFDPTLRRATQDDHPVFTETWARHHSDSTPVMVINDALSFRVGRTTALSDGNIAGSTGGLSEPGSSGHVASVAQSEGEYDLYDLSLAWDALQTDDLSFSLLSGVKAIDANIAKRISGAGGTTSIDSERRVVLIPMVGSGVRWQLSDDLSISGSALTHPVETGDALVDFNAATDLRITRNIDFTAGYRIIRSTFDVGAISSELTQEGLFARLQIRF